MAARKFLKHAITVPVLLLCAALILSVAVAVGYQVTGTMKCIYEGIVHIEAADSSGSPDFVPSAGRPALALYSPTPQIPRSALSGTAKEVTASWYGSAHHAKITASGQPFDMHKNTLAHKTLPLGTKVRLINLKNGRSAVGVVNDRGPYIEGRDVDVSYAIAKQLGFIRKGIIKLIIEPVRMVGEMGRED